MNIEKLKAFGVDYESVLPFFAGDPDQYEKFMQELVTTDYCGQILAALQTGKNAEAFFSAHRFHGLLLYLGVSRLTQEAEAVTEALRSNSGADVAAQVRYLQAEMEMLKAIVLAD